MTKPKECGLALTFDGKAQPMKPLWCILPRSPHHIFHLLVDMSLANTLTPSERRKAIARFRRMRSAR